METEYFIKNRISFQVAPYALYDVVHALLNDIENHTNVVVTKEDGNLVVMVAKQRYRKDTSNGETKCSDPVSDDGNNERVCDDQGTSSIAPKEVQYRINNAIKEYKVALRDKQRQLDDMDKENSRLVDEYGKLRAILANHGITEY